MDKRKNRPGGQPLHPKAGKPAARKAQPVAKAGPFDEIRFPVRFLVDPQDNLDDYEFVVEVATPDGRLDEGEVEVRGDTLLVRYEPEQLGRHTLRVTADGTSICPPQNYVVRDDGSCQKINAKTSSSGENDPKPKARPGSAGSTRSNRSTASDGTGSGDLKRHDSNLSRSSRLSTSSSLDRLANATTTYSVPGSPESEMSRHSSFSSQASSGYQESAGNEDEEGEEEVFDEDGNEYGEEDDDESERADEEPANMRRPPGGNGSLRKYTPSAQRTRSPSSPAFEQGRQGTAKRQRAVSDSGLRGAKGSAGRSKSPQPSEVFTSPNGNMFIFLSGTAKKLQNMGQSPSGATLTKADDGSMWLVKDGQAVPFQAQSSGKLRVSAVVGNDTSDVLRCAACYRKLKNKKNRARVDQLHFCRDHFKKLFSRRPAFEHKRFLAEPPRSSAWSDFPIPVANFTGLGFKEYHKAQAEFSKYDPDDSYFVNIGLAKPLLANRLQAHAIKESKVREYFLTARFNRAVHDMGLRGADSLSELEFLNLLSMAVRELTQKWMKKVSMDMQPMQKSWSTSALELHHSGGTFSKQYIQYGGRPDKFGFTPGRSGFKPVSQRQRQQQQQQQYRSAGARRNSADDGRNPDYPHGMPRREDPEGSAEDDDVYDREAGMDDAEREKGTYTIYEADEPAEASADFLGDGGSETQDDEDLDRTALAAVLGDDDQDDDDDEDDDDDDEDDDDDDEDNDLSEVGITGDKVADSWMIY